MSAPTQASVPISEPIVVHGPDGSASHHTGGTLLLASTPLHTFFALGLLQGPMHDGARTLCLIDQPPGAQDPLANALERARWPGLTVMRFAALRSGARAELQRFSALAAELSPRTIAVGMDHRLEFYAAVRGFPAARRVYFDDGLYSYLPHQHAKPVWRERLSDWRRGLKYGLRVERPALVGGSRAVQEAFVLLPGEVHAGLANKPVQALRPEWFAGDAVRAVCASASAAAGFDAARCAGIGLLLLLPHPRFLQSDAALKQRLVALVWAKASAGHTVALKSHPNAGVPAHQQLDLPPDLSGRCVEVPARLPAEVLAPLLHDTLVVGTLTTALLSLALLGRSLRVYRLPRSAPPTDGFEAGAERIYDAAGVQTLDDVAAVVD